MSLKGCWRLVCHRPRQPKAISSLLPPCPPPNRTACTPRVWSLRCAPRDHLTLLDRSPAACSPPPFPVQAKGVEFVLPTDVVVADKFDKDANAKVVPVTAIPDGWMVSRLAALVGGRCVWLLRRRAQHLDCSKRGREMATEDGRPEEGPRSRTWALKAARSPTRRCLPQTLATNHHPTTRHDPTPSLLNIRVWMSAPRATSSSRRRCPTARPSCGTAPWASL